MSHLPGCWNCESSIDESMIQPYTIRGATYDSNATQSFLPAAVAGGLWSGWDMNSPLVKTRRSKLGSTGMILTLGDRFDNMDCPTDELDHPGVRSAAPTESPNATLYTGGFGGLLPPPPPQLLPGGAIQFPGGSSFPLWISSFSRRTITSAINPYGIFGRDRLPS
jgi:hypothetical protein